jgi:hypothetical protein
MSPDHCRVAAHARQAHARALGDAIELVRQQGRVGGDHDDDRTGVAAGTFGLRRERRIGIDAIVAQMLADRHAGDAQRVAHAVVRLHEHADGVARLPSPTGATRCRCRT